MEQTIMIMLKTAAISVVWLLGRFFNVNNDTIKGFFAGFCMAEALTVLCGRCSWIYSVVFGELPGFLMLAVTIAGSLLLFSFFSGEKSGVVLTGLYIFFSSIENEYNAVQTPIINTTAHALRLGAAGINEAKGKRISILIVLNVAGGLLSLSNQQMPAAFAAISCCALLYNAAKNISSEPCCLTGAAVACLLAYF